MGESTTFEVVPHADQPVIEKKTPTQVYPSWTLLVPGWALSVQWLGMALVRLLRLGMNLISYSELSQEWMFSFFIGVAHAEGPLGDDQ